MLVVDTLSQFSGVRGDEEKSRARPWRDGAAASAAASGIAILISRHDRKSGGESGDSGRGSSAYAGAVDIILHLQRLISADASKQRQRELKSLSRFEETRSTLIELNEAEPYTYRVVGDAVEVRDRELRVEILAQKLSIDADDAIDTRELEQVILGRSIDIRRVLKLLVNEHEVVRVGEGRKNSPYRYYQRVFGGDADDED